MVKSKLVILIPCYNEAKSIATVINKIPVKKIQQAGLETEILVINNNSTDNTREVAEGAGATVIDEHKKGKGNAMRRGFSSLPEGTDYVVMLDGDDTYSPEEILRMIEPLSSDFCDAVIGSRLGGHIQAAAMTPFNRLGNWFFTNAVRIVYRANITDVLTGYFAWKKEAIDALYPHLKSDGFAIEMEMVTKMARLGQRLASVPISYHPREGESNLHPVRDGARILRMFLKNLTWKIRAKRPAPYTKKIVFVSDAVYPYMMGGKEKRLHEISKRLASMGYDVHIYTMHWWKGSEKVRVEDGVTLHALCRRYDMYHGNRRAIKEAVMFSISCLKLFRVKFDVLDVDHMPFFPILATWLVCTIRRRKFYGTWHEALSSEDWRTYMGRSGKIAALVEHITIRLPYRITAASIQTKELLASIHGRVERVGLVASGIDTDLMSKVKPADVRCDVLYVGRLVKDKNVNKLIQAVGQVAKRRSDVRCIIIGKGSEKQRLERQVTRLKLQKNVKFIESLNESADIYSYMKAAKVFCSPSIREGFGIVSLEALGCGTPVITTSSAANAARHLIQDGHNGSIVAPTPTAIAEAIAHWTSVQKPDLTIRMADHSWDLLAKKQAEVYML